MHCTLTSMIPTCVLDAHDAPTVALVGLCLFICAFVLAAIALAGLGEHVQTPTPRLPPPPKPRGASRVKRSAA